MRARRSPLPVLAACAALVVAASLFASAAAHAYLEGAEPAPGSVHVGAVEVLTLRYTSPVEPRFSSFELYRLDLPEGAVPADPAAPSPRDLQRIEALAARLAGEVRDGTHDVDTRIASHLRESAGSRTITLDLDAPLAPGVYVLLWEVLASDGHTTRDHHVFLVVDA